MSVAYSLTATFIGADDLKRAISEGSSIARSEMAKALNKAANDLQNEAVKNAPKLHGKLKSSIHTEHATASDLTAKVGTNVVYARAQEFGTVGMTINVSNGRRTKSGGRTRPYSYAGNIKPKYYMKQAFEDIRSKMSTYTQVALRNMIDRLSGK